MFRILPLLLLAGLSLTCDASEKLKVFAGITYGLHHLEQDKPTGTATKAVEALMDASGIPYEILMMNWAQAQKQTQEVPNSLLFAFARSPQREEQFSWLVPLGQLQLKIARLSSRPELEITDFQALKKYKLAAVRTLSTHQMLSNAGMQESEQLLLVESSSRLLKVLDTGLVDFIFYEEAIFAPILEKYHYPPTFLTATDIKVPWPDLWLYLAGNLELSPKIKDHIQATHQRMINSDKSYQAIFKNILKQRN